jgi:hypothetical protein
MRAGKMGTGLEVGKLGDGAGTGGGGGKGTAVILSAPQSLRCAANEPAPFTETFGIAGST